MKHLGAVLAVQLVILFLVEQPVQLIMPFLLMDLVLAVIALNHR